MKVRTWVYEADEEKCSPITEVSTGDYRGKRYAIFKAGYETIAELCLTEGEAQQLAGHLAKAFGTTVEASVRFEHDKGL